MIPMIITRSSAFASEMSVLARTRFNLKYLSTQVEKESGGYTLSKKQRKAMRLIEDDTEKSPDEQLSSAVEKMRQQSLMQDMEQDQNNPNPWYALLLHPSRALWRSSPKPPPKYLLDTQYNIIKASERTPKQLRRTYDRIIANHNSISERRERERRRMVNGSGHSENSLEAKRQRGIDSSITPVYYKAEQSVCSLKYRLVPNYSITKRILAETQSLLGKENFRPKRLLDVGVGAGSASSAALDYFNEDGSGGVEWIHGIEPSQSMRDASNIILSQVLQGQKFAKSGNGKTRITFSDNFSSAELNGAKAGGSFDLALCAYTMNEVPSVVASLAMAAIVWEKLSPGGVGIFIEPGTPDGFNALRSVRSMLLDCCPPDDESNVEGEEECHVIAPCTHNGTCPMVRHQKNFHKNMNLPDIDEEVNDDDVEGDDDIDVEKGNSASASETDAFDSAFCSFVHVMPGGTQRKQGEKFAYLVVQKRICGSDNDLDLKNPFSDTNIVDLLKKSLNAENKGSPRDHDRRKSLLRAARDIEDKFLDSDSDRLGLELVRGDNRKSWGRIIRAPLKKKGHVYVDYCASVKDEEGTETGRIVRSTVSRAKSAKSAPGMFLSSRKSRWGGLWPDLSFK